MSRPSSGGRSFTQFSVMVACGGTNYRRRTASDVACVKRIFERYFFFTLENNFAEAREALLCPLHDADEHFSKNR
jgi:hypothetical protein